MFRSCLATSVVMAGLVPAIHDSPAAQKTWMPATSAGMTGKKCTSMQERENPTGPAMENSDRKKDQAMKIIDMSHVMNVHTPGWVGYAGNKMYYAQNLQTQMIVAQRIDTALHVGTHFDGAMHATDNRKGDMASLPLDYLVNRGVVVDISGKMSDWAVITPEIIEGAAPISATATFWCCIPDGIATTKASRSRIW